MIVAAEHLSPVVEGPEFGLRSYHHKRGSVVPFLSPLVLRAPSPPAVGRSHANSCVSCQGTKL